MTNQKLTGIATRQRVRSSSAVLTERGRQRFQGRMTPQVEIADLQSTHHTPTSLAGSISILDILRMELSPHLECNKFWDLRTELYDSIHLHGIHVLISNTFQHAMTQGSSLEKVGNLTSLRLWAVLRAFL
jgi:hypothetical protein